MSTRSNIHFTGFGSTTIVANIYRHSDGYPEGVFPDLEKFFDEVERQTSDTRFDDPSYLAAKFVVWQAGENAKIAAYDYKNGRPGEVKPLDFLSVGVVSYDAADGEYIYTVACGVNGRPTVTGLDTYTQSPVTWPPQEDK